MSAARDTEGYLPALAYRFLTPLYDPLIRVSTRERAFKGALIDQAAIAEGMDVLDVGSGTGTLAIWIKERCPGCRVTGLDGDPDVLGRARAKAKARDLDIVFREGLSYALPF